MNAIKTLTLAGALAASLPLSAAARPHEEAPDADWLRVFRALARGGRLGIQVQALTPELRTHFGAPEDAGVLVSKVLPGTPAENAGVNVGDVILEVDGTSVAGTDELIRRLQQRNPGDEIAILVLRDKRKNTLMATLAEPGEVEGGGFPFEHGFRMHGMAPFADREAMQRRIDELEKRLQKLEERLEAGGKKKR